MPITWEHTEVRQRSGCLKEALDSRIPRRAHGLRDGRIRASPSTPPSRRRSRAAPDVAPYGYSTTPLEERRTQAGDRRRTSIREPRNAGASTTIRARRGAEAWHKRDSPRSFTRRACGGVRPPAGGRRHRTEQWLERWQRRGESGARTAIAVRRRGTRRQATVLRGRLERLAGRVAADGETEPLRSCQAKGDVRAAASTEAGVVRAPCWPASRLHARAPAPRDHRSARGNGGRFLAACSTGRPRTASTARAGWLTVVCSSWRALEIPAAGGVANVLPCACANIAASARRLTLRAEVAWGELGTGTRRSGPPGLLVPGTISDGPIAPRSVAPRSDEARSPWRQRRAEKGRCRRNATLVPP